MLRARTQALKSDVALRCPRDRERESEREKSRRYLVDKERLLLLLFTR